jgi:hypothetical protein
VLRGVRPGTGPSGLFGGGGVGGLAGGKLPRERAEWGGEFWICTYWTYYSEFLAGLD